MLLLLGLFLAARWLELVYCDTTTKLDKCIWHALYFLLVFAWEATLLVHIENTSKEDIAQLMLTQVVWYINGFFESLVVDRNRKDFHMLLIHHVVTIFLIVAAERFNEHLFALVVFTEQDICDILINVSKIMHYTINNKILNTIAIVTLTGTWWLTRVGFLGCVVCYAVSQHAWVICVMLLVLFGMQLIWGLALVDICRRYWQTGVIHDSLEDKKLE